MCVMNKNTWMSSLYFYVIFKKRSAKTPEQQIYRKNRKTIIPERHEKQFEQTYNEWCYHVRRCFRNAGKSTEINGFYRH